MREPAPGPQELSRGALERAGANLPPRARAVGVPLDWKARPTGEVELVHRETGEVCGVCVTPAIAAQTLNFLA